MFLFVDSLVLEICDCEVATGHNGLNCNKEGFFIAKF